MYRDGNRTYHSLATCPPTCSGTLRSQVRDLGRSLTQQLWDIKLRDSTSARRLSSRCFFFFYAFLRVWYFLERAFVVTFLPRMVPPIYTHTHPLPHVAKRGYFNALWALILPFKGRNHDVGCELEEKYQKNIPVHEDSRKGLNLLC